MLVRFLILILVIGCTSSNKSNDKTMNDTLTFNSVEIPGLTDSLNQFRNVFIPNYFEITDSLELSLNSDSKSDYLLVLTPKTLIDPSLFDLQDSSARRLVVSLIGSDHGYAISEVFPNLISDFGGVNVHYSGLTKSSEGFVITHKAGNRYSWTYDCHFAYREKIFLDRITKTCKVDDFLKQVEYSYLEDNIRTINIPDTLKVDCNCDEIWDELSDQLED